MARLLLLLAIVSIVAVGSVVVAFASLRLTTNTQTNVQESNQAGLQEIDETPDLSTPGNVNDLGDGCAMPSECEEGTTGDETDEPAPEDMPTVIGRQPEIAGPAADQCKKAVDDAFDAILANGSDSDVAYIGEHVQDIYCNDVHVVVPGIHYNHDAYFLHKTPSTFYLNPAAYTDYSTQELIGLLYHEAKHSEQFAACKADSSKCMSNEEREQEARDFQNNMIVKIFPADPNSDPIVIIYP